MPKTNSRVHQEFYVEEIKKKNIIGMKKNLLNREDDHKNVVKFCGVSFFFEIHVEGSLLLKEDQNLLHKERQLRLIYFISLSYEQVLQIS